MSVTQIKTSNIENSSVTAAKLHSTAVTDKLGFTPASNAVTLTINGTGYDLTANRTWTIAIPTQATLSVDDLITLSGVSEGSTTLGTFTGTTISNNQTVKAALQDLETTVETKENIGVAVAMSIALG